MWSMEAYSIRATAYAICDFPVPAGPQRSSSVGRKCMTCPVYLDNGLNDSLLHASPLPGKVPQSSIRLASTGSIASK